MKMPKVNFNNIEDSEKYPLLPAGKYRCFLDNVEESKTRNDDVMWRLWHKVSHGPYQGRVLFDNLVFNKKCLTRVKALCDCARLNTSGEQDIGPEQIIGCECYITAGVEDYETKQGIQKKRNVVIFDGYEPVPPGESTDNTDDHDTSAPF